MADLSSDSGLTNHDTDLASGLRFAHDATCAYAASLSSNSDAAKAYSDWLMSRSMQAFFEQFVHLSVSASSSSSGQLLGLENVDKAGTSKKRKLDNRETDGQSFEGGSGFAASTMNLKISTMDGQTFGVGVAREGGRVGDVKAAIAKVILREYRILDNGTT